MTLRVGSHPDNLSLFILRHRGELETQAVSHGWQVEWMDYQHGADSAAYLASHQLDIVGTGTTSPLYAQAKGLDVAYLGASPVSNANCALLVMKESHLQVPQQIKGTRIACIRGSVTDRFLAQQLLQNGLTLKDITLVDLSGSESPRALREGRVDLWAAIDPWLSAARDAKMVRMLGQVDEFIANRTLFWCRKSWRERYPRQARLALSVLAENDRWIATHPLQAAELIHQHLAGSISVESWFTALRRRSWGILPVSTELLAEQQRQADDLVAAGFLNNSLIINSARQGLQA
ncbi:ABC transporter substrate-binding protein [Pantoea sp. CCBC3-3-1]|uniref:ABC transporter substrate-binding protein n=1 Tax=Pantoea sp. CCBC3-3-1 TaxID=2490851 RepID=UPI0011BF5D8C|nr:ABC transporter substrate-binding protein [Pantoea sp. CCBC3-3-1]